MITDKNILASKHTKGIWQVVDTYENYEPYTPDTPQIIIWDGDEQASGPICDMGEMGDMNYAEALANAHIISAAPEAIEFIADLLEKFDKGLPFDAVVDVQRAENILKKAYNL